MSAPAANLSVLVGNHSACIRIAGRANFTMSIDFKALLVGLRQKGYTYFVIDLSECLLMDSTFLGVLAGFGLKMSQPDGKTPACPVELHNPNARVTELVENVGVLHLFKVTQGPLSAPEVLETCTTETTRRSREEITRACLEAHQTLMEINPDNVARFKEVARFLAEDLQKLKDRT
jgi:anti-anti-sigma regulatory factor